MKFMIAAIVLIGLGAAAASIIVGSRIFDGTVTKKPYEQGLLWDRKQKENQESGLNVTVENSGFNVGKNVLALVIADKGKALGKAPVQVTVSRPSTTAYDKTYTCQRTNNGTWRADVELPLYGYWDFNIQVGKGQNGILFGKRVFAE